MKSGPWYVALGLTLIVIMLGGSALYLRAKPAPAATAIATTTTPAVDYAASSIYTSGLYGFSFVYPGTYNVSDTYTAIRGLSDGWRVNALASGTPIVEVMHTTDAGVAAVRVGASNLPKAVTACKKVGPGETLGAPATMGSTTFAVFSYTYAGTDQQVAVTSYRAVHEGYCVALETLESLPDHGQATASSSDLAAIVSSFSFARP